MVKTVIAITPFNRQDIQRFFNHENRAFISRVIRANLAGIRLTYVKAKRTNLRLCLKILPRFRKAIKFSLWNVEKIKRQPLRGFWADPRKPLESCNELFDCFGNSH